MSSMILLRNVSFFSKLTEDELNLINNIVKTKTYKENSIIFREKDISGELFIIDKGVVKIYKESASGRKTLASFKNGDVFGELSLFDDLPRSATAVASVESVLLTIKNDDLNKIMNLNMELRHKILKNAIHEISLRLRETNERIQDNILWTLTAKL